MTKVRPSVVGKFTSSICTAASLSSTARGVRPPVRVPITEEEAPRKTWAQEEDDAAAEVTDVS